MKKWKIYKPGRSGAGCSALVPSLLYFWAFRLLCLCFFELSAFGLLGLWALGPFEDNFMKQIRGYASNSLPVIYPEILLEKWLNDLVLFSHD